MAGRRMPDYYDILDVDYEASKEEIDAVYRQKRRTLRGDKRLPLITEAWSVLSDSLLREDYDREIRVEEKLLLRQTQRRRSKPTSRLSTTEILDDDGPAGPGPTNDSGQRTLSRKKYGTTEILDDGEEPPPATADRLGEDDDITQVRPDGEDSPLPAAHLDVVHLDGRQERLQIRTSKTTIGRKDSSDVLLEDPEKYISRRHAHIVSDEGQYYLVDLDSQNGTRLGSRRIPALKRVSLSNGDCIDIEGRKLTFRLGTRH